MLEVEKKCLNGVLPAGTAALVHKYPMKPVLPEHLEPLGTWKAEAFIWTQVHISTLNVACVQLHSLNYLFCYSIPMLVNLL